MKRMTMYREFLEKAGCGLTPLSAAQIRYRIEVLHDEFWLEFLHIDESEVQASLEHYRRLLAQVERKK